MKPARIHISTHSFPCSEKYNKNSVSLFLDLLHLFRSNLENVAILKT